MLKVICHDIHHNEKEFDSEKLTHRPSVYGILIENNKILLSKQYDGYDFPGGGIELHETIDQALVREFWEETGLKIKPGKIMCSDTSFFIDARGQSFNCTLIYKIVEKVSGTLSKDNLDPEEKKYADMPEWIDLNDIGKIKFYNGLERGSTIDSVALIQKALEKL